MNYRLSTALVVCAVLTLFSSLLLPAQTLETWNATGQLNIGRTGHRAAVLNTGEVLVTGGAHEFAHVSSCELYNPGTGVWAMTAPMINSRYFHTATLLQDGEVLTAGGLGSSGSGQECDTYDPITRTWMVTGAMKQGRRSHTATLLYDGSVLIVGGDTGNVPFKSCEVYYAGEREWGETGAMKFSRTYHTATLLKNGLVLVTGGDSHEGDSSITTATCELYNPATGIWANTHPMWIARSNHEAVLMPDGRVLVMGGYNRKKGQLESCEIYDPQAGMWSVTAPISTARSGHTAVALANGKILLVGGVNYSDGRTYLSRCEVYNPATGTWKLVDSLANPATTPAIAVLRDGRVLVAGGFRMKDYPLYDYIRACELFNYPSTNVLSVGNTDNTDDGFTLEQNYPNPVASHTVIRYSIPNSFHVSLTLHDVSGRIIRTLIDNKQSAGEHTVELDASTLSAGTYFYRWTAGDHGGTRTLVVVK